MHPAVTVIGGWIYDFFSKRSESRQRIAEAKETAKIKRIEKGMDNSGWKDEFLVLLIGFPYIMAFIPQTQQTALNGFKILEQYPEWYVVAFLGIVSAVFGLARLRDYKFKQDA